MDQTEIDADGPAGEIENQGAEHEKHQRRRADRQPDLAADQGAPGIPHHDHDQPGRGPALEDPEGRQGQSK